MTDPHYKANLEAVLDFVERWNKKDEEQNVAVAAEYLRDSLWSAKVKAQKIFYDAHKSKHHDDPMCIRGDPSSQHIDGYEHCVIPECGCREFNDRNDE